MILKHKIEQINFVNNNGKYESTNQGQDNTVANSYIPIDLTNGTGKYKLTVKTYVKFLIFSFHQNIRPITVALINTFSYFSTY